MTSKGIELIKTEWKLTFLFLTLIVALGCIPIFLVNNGLLNIFLYAFGLDLYNGYFTIIGKKLRGDSIENEYKSLIFSKDKNGSDFLILLVFFGAILLIFKGPMILFGFLFAEKTNELLNSSSSLLLALTIVVAILGAAFKISIYSAAASLKYFNNEVIDSFKTGVKGIWNFKFFVLFFLLYNFLVSYLANGQNPIVLIPIKLSFYILPALLMIFMVSKYHQDEQKKQSSIMQVEESTES